MARLTHPVARPSPAAPSRFLPLVWLGIALAVLLASQAVRVEVSRGLFGSMSAPATGVTTAAVLPPDAVWTLNEAPGSLDVAWNASLSPIATGYQVYRSDTSGGPFTPVGTALGAGTLSVTDAGLQPNTTYYYVVRALAGPWTSAESTEASGTTLP